MRLRGGRESQGAPAQGILLLGTHSTSMGNAKKCLFFLKVGIKVIVAAANKKTPLSKLSSSGL